MWQLMHYLEITFLYSCPPMHRPHPAQPRCHLRCYLCCWRKARLDIGELDKMVDFYFQRALANSTQCSYALVQSCYCSFCVQFNISPIPIQEPHLCRFASFLANDNASHSTMKC